MSRVFSQDDTRHQSELDEEIPVLLKLTCGATSGATAQSSEEYLFLVTTQ